MTLYKGGRAGCKIVKYSVMQQSICLSSTSWQLLSRALVSFARNSRERQWGITLVGKVCSGKSFPWLVNVCLMLSAKLTTREKTQQISLCVHVTARSADPAEQLQTPGFFLCSNGSMRHFPREEHHCQHCNHTNLIARTNTPLQY